MHNGLPSWRLSGSSRVASKGDAVHVAELWRHPVKSLQGEPLDEAVVEGSGLSSDRRWGIVDDATGMVLTARRVAPPRRRPAGRGLRHGDGARALQRLWSRSRGGHRGTVGPCNGGSERSQATQYTNRNTKGAATPIQPSTIPTVGFASAQKRQRVEP